MKISSIHIRVTFFLLLAISLLPKMLLAQDREIDSLGSLLKSSLPDTSRIDIMLSLADVYSYQNSGSFRN